MWYTNYVFYLEYRTGVPAERSCSLRARYPRVPGGDTYDTAKIEHLADNKNRLLNIYERREVSSEGANLSIYVCEIYNIW